MHHQLAMPHVMRSLLATGHINGKRRPHHYTFAIDNRSEVERTLKNLGMVLVVDTTMQIMHARNMTPQECDLYDTKNGCSPIQPLAPTKRMNFWESIAALHFRNLLDQEIREGGAPIWIHEDDACEALSVYASDASAADKTAAYARVVRTLAKLVEIDLLEKSGNRYKGHPLLYIAISRDQTAAFTHQIERALANLVQEPSLDTPTADAESTTA